MAHSEAFWPSTTRSSILRFESRSSILRFESYHPALSSLSASPSHHESLVAPECRLWIMG